MAPGDAPGNEAVARARALIGTRFRLHGRGADGIDCVGLAAAALDIGPVPTGYALRGGSAETAERMLAGAGLVRAAGGTRPGDVLLIEAGPAQLHLAVATGDGIVHADAGLRRVAERPGAPPGRIVSRWRRRKQAGGGRRT